MENEPADLGVNGATNNNVGSNCHGEKEAQTKQEMEEVEWKWNRLVTGERTEQSMEERFPLEQQTAKERVLKEYESGGSGVTCRTFSKEDSNSLPDQPKEGKMEPNQPAYSQFEVLFLARGKRSSFQVSFGKSRTSKRSLNGERPAETGAF